MGELRAYWDGLLSTFTVKSPDEKLNRMVNIWNPYQCMVTFNMSRSASYFETGIGRGMGFRDSNQDLLGFVHQIPERARERIIDIASTQFADGSAYHQYQPLTKRGNNDIGSGFNDDPLWLILGVAAYIKETGDYAILDEQVPFDNDAKNQAPLFEHLRRSFQHVLNNLGPHGLPLIGRADWNDCLNLNCFSETPDEPYQTTGNRTGRTAESVFIAGMFVAIGPEWAALARAPGAAATRPNQARDRRDADGGRRPEARLGRRVVPPGLRLLRQEGRQLEGVPGGTDLHRAARATASWAGSGLETGEARKALDSVKTAPRHEVRHRAAATRLPRVPRRAGRDLLLSARLQGERRHLLPQQPVDHDRRDHARPAAIAPSSTTRRSPRPTSRRSARSTAPSPTSTRRWSPARTRCGTGRRRTGG